MRPRIGRNLPFRVRARCARSGRMDSTRRLAIVSVLGETALEADVPDAGALDGDPHGHAARGADGRPVVSRGLLLGSLAHRPSPLFGARAGEMPRLWQT